jgi:hypothetical protein
MTLLWLKWALFAFIVSVWVGYALGCVHRALTKRNANKDRHS